MCWAYVLGILGIILMIVIIFGVPRKKCERVANFEGIDDPAVAKAFEWVTNFLPFRMLRKIVIRRLKIFQPSGTLVDVGCGNGKLLFEIAQALPGLKLVGVDIAEQMLAQARENATARRIADKIEFKIGAAERLPFGDNTVDCVVSTLSLHHWANPEIVFQELLRVLKPGGLFLVFDFRRDARKAFYGLFHFATSVVVPKPLKKVHEPLGSILASYTPVEIATFFTNTRLPPPEIQPTLAWLFIIGRKGNV
jgi:ubiquinone/menaquinone biosynthesis C-methylase UbiE